MDSDRFENPMIRTEDGGPSERCAFCIGHRASLFILAPSIAHQAQSVLRSIHKDSNEIHTPTPGTTIQSVFQVASLDLLGLFTHRERDRGQGCTWNALRELL